MSSEPKLDQSSGDLYQILGVSRDASLAEIKNQYRKLSLVYHPDKKTGDERKFADINFAYKVLSSKKKRSKYDHSLSSTFDEIRNAVRDVSYHRNQDFITVNEQGKEVFNEQKFAAEFERQNETLDTNIQVRELEVNEKGLETLLAERDSLLNDLDKNFKGNADQLKHGMMNNPLLFNQVFDDLKKKNKELVEVGSELGQGLGFHGGPDGQAFSDPNLWNSNLTPYGDGFSPFAGNSISDWSMQQQTGIITDGQSSINLHAPGFQAGYMDSIIDCQRQYQQPVYNEWKQATPEELLQQRMAEYQEETKRLHKLTENDFKVHHDPSKLSFTEVDQPEIIEENEGT